ncbi:HD domain-containing phosphohydrolase [Fusibacter sp. JL216-2]|uniref:HD domain-containing phosphohydrolase n=1 Tax=Fusibacter sp. JL216-2 TaxID=3071453 RepID=UPI003D33C7A4
MDKWDIDDLELDFLQDDIEDEEETVKETYKIIVADDDEEIHRVTKMILRDFEFEGKKLEFIDTYSGIETIKVLEEVNDVAIVLLDVVMEKSTAGLEVVEHLRNILKNNITRIVLRTGQPGEAPEEKIIRDFDINDYRLKTELTVKRLNTTLYSALRNYRDLRRLERHRNGLEKIIQTSARLFEHNSLKDFLMSILNELSNFNGDRSNMLYIRENINQSSNGFVTMEKQNKNTIVAATGKYENFVGKEVEAVPDLSFINKWMHNDKDPGAIIHSVDDGVIIQSSGKSHLSNYIYIEGEKSGFDMDLIQLFLSNYSIALDNYILNNMVNTTQKEIAFALGEIVDSHHEETGSHVKRLSEMMYQFCLCNHYSYSESEIVKVASTMHDLGKIAIPDMILKKPGKLDAEEFDVIKSHTTHGYKILSNSDLEVLKIAADIALNHHEKFDGSGYPAGKKGREIPLNARMLSIVDVFDAMTHRRVYKEAESKEEAIAYINSQRGKHFDPNLVDVFMNNLDAIVKAGEEL